MVSAKIVSSGLLKEIFIANVVYVTYLKIGICRSYTAFFIPELQADRSIPLSTDQESWIGSIPMFMCPIGCLIGGIMFDVIGRKITMSLQFIPFLVGWAVIAFAQNIEMFYIGMFLNGIASGSATCSPTYLAEICSAKYRGPLLTIMEPFFTVGIFLCNCMVYWVGWRRSAMYFSILSFVSALLMLLVPESPSWLVDKGSRSKAMKVLTSLRDSDVQINREITEIDNHFASNRSRDRTLTEIIKDVSNSWKPLMIFLVTMSCAHGSGYTVMEVYTETFFRELRIPFDSSMATMIHSFICFVASLLCLVVSSVMGRKSLLIVSSFGMAAVTAVAAAYETVYYSSPVKPFFWVPLVAVYAQSFLTSLGVSVIPFLLVGEIFRLEIRGVMCGISESLGYIFGAVVVKLFPMFLRRYTMVAVLWVFVASSLINGIFAIFFVPETKGKSLSEIQETYFSKKPKNDDACP